MNYSIKFALAGIVIAILLSFTKYMHMGSFPIDYSVLLPLVSHFLIACISFLPFVVINIWFMCFTAYLHFASFTFFFVFGLNWLFAAEFLFMLFTVHNVLFLVGYVYFSQKSIYGECCFHHVIANVKTGKGMKRRIKSIINNHDSIALYYSQKFDDSTFSDFVNYSQVLHPSNSTFSEFEDHHNRKPIVTLTTPEDQQTCEDFTLQNGHSIFDTIMDVLSFVNSEYAYHPFLKDIHIPFLYKFRGQFRELRSQVKNLTGISITGWVAYALAKVYVNRKIAKTRDTYRTNHGELDNPVNLINGVIRSHDGCTAHCCKTSTFLTLVRTYCTSCERYFMFYILKNTAFKGIDFITANIGTIINLLGEENEFGDVLRELFNVHRNEETTCQGSGPIPDVGYLQDGLFDDVRIMDIIRELLKEETVKTLKSAMKVATLLTGILALLHSNFTYEETLCAIKEYDFPKMFASASFSSVAASISDFLNKLIEAYQTGSLRSLFGLDKEARVLRDKVAWFKSVDVSSLNGGVIPYDGKLTETGDKMYFIHEFLMFGRNLRDDVVKRLALEEAKIGNARDIKTWKCILRDVDIKIAETDVAIDSIGLRRKPFTYMVIGKSSIGKTSVVNILQRVLCTAFRLPCDPSFMYYVNDLLKHWDGFHSSAHTIVWDDASSLKLSLGSDPGFLSQMLNVIGNQPFTTPQAHLENKGNCKVNSRIVAITSNNLTLQSETVMNAPEAVMRRIDLIVHATLRREHSKEGMLANVNPDPKCVSDMNYWFFDVYTVAITGPETRFDPFTTQGDPTIKAMAYNDFELKRVAGGITITELNKLVYEKAQEQETIQKIVLASGDQISQSEYEPSSGDLIFQVGDSEIKSISIDESSHQESEGCFSTMCKKAFGVTLYVVKCVVYCFIQRAVMKAGDQISESACDPVCSDLVFQDGDGYHNVRTWFKVVYDMIIRFSLYCTKCLVYCFIHYMCFTFPVVVSVLWVLLPPLVSLLHTILHSLPVFVVVPFFVGLTIQCTGLDSTFNIYRVPVLLGLDMFANGFLDADQIEKDVERLNRESDMPFWNPMRWYYRIKRIGRKKPAPILVGITMLLASIRYASTYATAAEATQQGFTSDEGPVPSWSIWKGFSNLSQTSKSVANPSAIVKLVSENTRIIIFEDGRWGNAVDLCTNFDSVMCMTNYHTFKPQITKAKEEKRPVRFTVVYDRLEVRGKKGGIINGNASVEIDPDDIVCDETRDTAFFNYQGYPVKDITSYFCLKDHRGNSNTTAYLVKRDINNVPSVHESPYCHFYDDSLTLKNISGEIALQGKSDRFRVKLNPPTASGDCGAPLIQTDGNRTAIVGIHQAAGGSWEVSTRVTQDDILKARKLLNASTNDYPVLIAQDGAHSLPDLFAAMDDDARRIIPNRSTFQELHHKSVFHQINNPDEDLSGTVDILGSLGKSSRAQSTKVYPNPIAKELLEATELPSGNKVPPPSLRGDAFYRAKRFWLSSVLAIKRNAPLNLVRLATMGYITDSFARLYHSDMSEVKPISVDESINGPLGNGSLSKYMNGVTFSTGAGHPYGKAKRDLVVDPDAERKIFVPVVMAQIDRLLDNFRTGHSPAPDDVMFSSFFKDEALSEKKAKLGKHRIVIASPLGFLIAFRTLYLPILAFIAANRIAFEACPNTIVQSYEWTLQRDFVLDNGDDPKFFDGDYKGWDSSLQKAFVSCFFRVAYVIAYLSGNYTKEELFMMTGMAAVVSDSTVDFFGDVIKFCGFNPSGQPATTQTNCAGGAVMIRLAWLLSGFPIGDFRKNVRLLTYGDDNYGSISRGVDFDKTHIATKLAPYGITYTNADKTEPITPCSKLGEIEFLKRSWLWEPSIDAYLAPLSLETLGNMCCNIRNSAHESEHDIIASGLSSLVMESFYHGKDVYERIQRAVIKIAEGYNLPKTVYKTFEEKCVAFNEDSVYFRNNRDFILAQLAR